MSEKVEGFVMKVDDELLADAVSAVSKAAVDGRVEIPFRRGMFVAPATDEEIHAIRFFTEGGVRYVIGPLLK
jgi:hypothetical protein